jgi:hypothetical protein
MNKSGGTIITNFKKSFGKYGVILTKTAWYTKHINRHIDQRYRTEIPVTNLYIGERTASSINGAGKMAFHTKKLET